MHFKTKDEEDVSLGYFRDTLSLHCFVVTSFNT